MCHRSSLDTVCDRALRAPLLPCKVPSVLARPPWHRLQDAFCDRHALVHALALLRCIILLRQACLAAPHPHVITTTCPNTAKAPCICTVPARREAWNRPSGARFRPAAAAGAARRRASAAQARLRGPVTRPHVRTSSSSCRPAMLGAEDGKSGSKVQFYYVLFHFFHSNKGSFDPLFYIVSCAPCFLLVRVRGSRFTFAEPSFAGTIRTPHR